MQALANIVLLTLAAVGVGGMVVIVALIALEGRAPRRPPATVTPIGRRLPAAA